MNNKFDELAKGLAQSATRREALKKLGLGVAGIALGLLGLASRAHADSRRKPYHCNCKVGNDWGCYERYGFGTDGLACVQYCSFQCTQIR
jgi:hypothetical protein